MRVCAWCVHILGAPLSPQKHLTLPNNIFQSQLLTPKTQKVIQHNVEGGKSSNFLHPKFSKMPIFPKIQCFNPISISVSIESCNMGLKYVFNSYLDLLFMFRACPVCAPKRHSQHLKIGEFSKFFWFFQARAVPFGCTYWARAPHPKGV